MKQGSRVYSVETKDWARLIDMIYQCEIAVACMRKTIELGESIAFPMRRVL